ncbi:MAG TPA: Gfo/Idh/MocA family oxidoreductase [Gaiellaceae bacterium]|nr:Gfo/Idh/MocA family oxidoreductase [Gaiellaceae bacterium]
MTAWGLLSTARINHLVLAGARLSDHVDVIAVASRDRARAEAYAREYNIEHAYGSYDALLEDPAVEVVYISLPNSMHVKWTLRALAARKHVLCEKPFSRRALEVEQAFNVADREGLVLSEGFMWRHHPQTATLARLVAEGAIGRLRMIRAAFSFQLAAVHGAEDPRSRPELDGGSLMDVGCYCLNAVRLLAGEPERVYAEQVVGASGVDVCFAATLRFPGDVVAHFDCGFVIPYRDELEVVGDQASLHVDDPWHIDAPGIELRREPEPGKIEAEWIQVEPANSYQLELENVSEAIRGAAPLLLGRNDALAQARAIEALCRSAEAGVPVELEPPASFPVPASHWSDS